MITTLVILALIMATVIGWLLRQTLNTTPWEARAADDTVSGTSFEGNTRPLALAAFLAVVTSLFALFISAYLMRRDMADWSDVKEPDILWVNTLLLVSASLVYHRARRAAMKGEEGRLKGGLALAGILTFLFLAGQLLAWRQLHDSGYYLSSNPANAFFYLLTAVHGVHLMGGLWVWARSVVKVMTGAETETVRLSVQLCTVYWHYLLLVWLILFGLLLYT
ncbi:MAG TPA: cytochrome c oxidase subunit 3 [Woeseiaceae bacterium]|nr:cytochrome c oxidase subunit 3 [Woeseiaceae bacterium]